MLKQFFVYPWNWVVLILGLLLLVGGILYLLKGKR